MTNQQFTIAELGAKFGSQMGQVLSELIIFEKMAEAQRAQIREIAEDKINLENELAQLKSEIYELQHELQKAQNILSSEAAEIAEQGRGIIANEKEKAAPTAEAT